MKKVGVFSVDVEDGISISMRDNFHRNIDQTDRVYSLTSRILDFLGEQEMTGTFFFLGQVAEQFPELVKRTCQDGHEIGVHGYDHITFDKLNREKAYNELYRAKSMLEDLTGEKVKGHRAPAFSITPNTGWVLGLLIELGFEYDSSILPADLGKFSWPDFPSPPVKIEVEGTGSLIEYPITTVRIFGKKIPFSGGSYFRLLPLPLLKNLYKKVSKRESVIHYMHPYEIDQERYPDYYFDALKTVSYAKALKMRSFWINRSTVEPKLKSLAKDYRFTSFSRHFSPEIEFSLPTYQINL